MELSIEQASANIEEILAAGLVPFVSGAPGIGKSDIIKQVAKVYNLKIIDVRLSQSDPTDLSGFPAVDLERGKASYMPMDTFPVEGDEIPKGFAGWLLFFDEMNSAPMSVQAAAYRIVLDKEVGQHKLHKNVAVVCAGNRASDKAIVTRMSTAMQSRLIHLELGVNHKQWIDWGNSNGIDFRILAYINFRPEILHKFDPNHSEHTFPCPRTWEFVSKLIIKKPDLKASDLPLLMGCVGEGAGREFYGFTDIFTKLPTLKNLLSSPSVIAMPDEPSVLYAISGLISHHANKDNLDDLMIFINRMPKEFQVITISGFCKRERALVQIPVIRKWLVTNTDLM